ncbi:MAG: hypothetical protein A3I07_04270 [Candidatus Doudnabacteria bacterium RIFCSPLOWO2_02_FULL_42_9]|uniref:Uncharacterized protein n=1 Tax=Candidatus Doudnabacteria bacterium RIFCSPHIGHO2_01_FULL_41_86 TaxID=1817821 RepID=A0A1F5N8F3_9BACT|nr:MAG: hypothetical protein A2717_00150 [Candidatus Doudnabacteria bacterium RIFCSPHIGHO2_01_FULL_41_86]OGE75102.1 MAG: hypothetical protein A3K07_03655 [Candidatus Doudnabacteria bacterium RIFCSPHIGHO2_01_43_10]OGE86363.1 MAG: hypothetical protein A3E28_00025 [Candidatus Doudnabacteria bacterium RIFCSPHIGHO2_12_FULL_42_22]OGE87362.1 MAG: hypothetical protein A3C49_04010 [Candidatus Doudnabacteria bacterium RIFCSPHIGHO2_02_FULL_42_25]OGE92660.1 MAG: hypothetical protein A2895_03505 [Candidatus
MENTKPQSGSEIDQSFGGSVGVWAEGSKVILKAITKDNQPVSLTPAEAKRLAEMLKVFAAQVEAK